MLLYVKDATKVALNLGHGLINGLGRVLGVIDFAVPPNSSMRKTSSRSVIHYYLSGLTTYLPIVTAAKLYGITFTSETNVLDFGCGVGRQLLHMTRKCPRAKYFACDVDSTLVTFILRHYPMVDTHVNKFIPPLRYSDGSMNLIYSVSTFSHFDLETQQLWLREFFRILRPGGLALLTIEGLHALEMMKDDFPDTPERARELAEKGILYKEYWFLNQARKHEAGSPLSVANRARGIEGSYGATVMTPEFVFRSWSELGFEVMGISEGVIDQRQDLVVLRRRADTQLTGAQ